MLNQVDDAHSLLRRAFGPDAEFREGQREAIEGVLQPGARMLVVQRTGWGKSAVYFIAAAMVRSENRGVAIIVSPLLALMRNQIEMAARFGLRAATINSTNEVEWPGIEEALDRSEIDVLFISPERLANPRFAAMLDKVIADTGLLVIDEAHCISDWGHDFRPDYRRILDVVRALPVDASVLGTTATATDRVVQDVAKQLGDHVVVQRGSILRKSLRLSAFELPDFSERLAWLAKYLPKFPGTGIVYTLTIHDTQQVADYLNFLGISSAAYHSNLEHDSRLDLEDRFQRNELKALVATSALGMGYDKGDVGFVVHFQLPTSMLSYYQQIGRAGRMLEVAYASLLFGEQDLEIAAHFSNSAVPPRPIFDRILQRLKQGAATLAELHRGTGSNLSVTLQAINLLLVDNIMAKTDEGYVLRSDGGAFDDSRYRAIQALRLEESHEMLAYGRETGCRMQAIAAALNEKGLPPCGKCDRCKPVPVVALDPVELQRAEAFLKGQRFEIAPRAMLPGFDGESKGRKIDPALKLEPGLALSIYNDSGYGKLVRRAKYGPEPYGEELLEACAAMVRESGFSPDWITWVPSSTNHKVKEFAINLARKLNIPGLDAVRKILENAPQKSMLYGLAQYQNVRDAFEVDEVLPGKCLLIDDVVDSGWTLTIIGMALREAGSGPVMPLALATARPRRSV